MIWVLVSLLYLVVVLGISVLLRQYIWDQEPSSPGLSCDLWRMAAEDVEKPAAIDAETREVPTVIVDLSRDSVRDVTATLKHWQER